jgi:hypothetical protein
MTQSKWSILGYFASLCYLAATVYQYWYRYNDVSQFIMNAAIATLIFAVSFLYNERLANFKRIKDIEDVRLTAIEDYLADKRKVLSEGEAQEAV